MAEYNSSARWEHGTGTALVNQLLTFPARGAPRKPGEEGHANTGSRHSPKSGT